MCRSQKVLAVAFQVIIIDKVLPLFLGVGLSFSFIAFSGCDLYPQPDPSDDTTNPIQEKEQEEPIGEQKDRILVFLNTSHPDYQPLGYKEAHEEILVWKNILTRDEIGYKPEDIYVLGHDSYNIHFDNYRQLTRDNLNNLMGEIDEKYGEDAFLIINSMGHAGRNDKDSDGVYDSFFTTFAGENLPERYYSYEYPNLVYSFLRDDRQVMLNIHKCYAGYIKDAFVENPKDNVLVLASSKRDETTIGRVFLDNIIRTFRDAEKVDFTYFNLDNKLDSQEVYTYVYNRTMGVYDSNDINSSVGTPQMWMKATTDPKEFIIHTYELKEKSI